MDGRFRRSPAVESSPLQDDLMLFHPPSGKFCVLNRTTASIWTRLATPSTPEEIAHEVASAFRDITEGQALNDVETALGEMLSLGLVERAS
jgi:PqqD family protein of HPr-rel-A system